MTGVGDVDPEIEIQATGHWAFPYTVRLTYPGTWLVSEFSPAFTLLGAHWMGRRMLRRALRERRRERIRTKKIRERSYRRG